MTLPASRDRASGSSRRVYRRPSACHTFNGRYCSMCAARLSGARQIRSIFRLPIRTRPEAASTMITPAGICCTTASRIRRFDSAISMSRAAASRASRSRWNSAARHSVSNVRLARIRSRLSAPCETAGASVLRSSTTNAPCTLPLCRSDRISAGHGSSGPPMPSPSPHSSVRRSATSRTPPGPVAASVIEPRYGCRAPTAGAPGPTAAITSAVRPSPSTTRSMYAASAPAVAAAASAISASAVGRSSVAVRVAAIFRRLASCSARTASASVRRRFRSP